MECYILLCYFNLQPNPSVRVTFCLRVSFFRSLFFREEEYSPFCKHSQHSVMGKRFRIVRNHVPVKCICVPFRSVLAFSVSICLPCSFSPAFQHWVRVKITDWKRIGKRRTSLGANAPHPGPRDGGRVWEGFPQSFFLTLPALVASGCVAVCVCFFFITLLVREKAFSR